MAGGHGFNEPDHKRGKYVLGTLSPNGLLTQKVVLRENMSDERVNYVTGFPNVFTFIAGENMAF